MIKSQKSLNLFILIVFLTLIIVTLFGIANKKTGEFILAQGTKASTSLNLGGSEVNNIPKHSGDFIFYLHKGEFIPADSQVTFISKGIAKEFSLKNLVEQKPLNGTFYLKGSPISGEGLGYGIKGLGKVYPEISAKLEISSLFFKERNKEIERNLSFYKPLLIPLSREEMIKLKENSIKYKGETLPNDEVSIKVQKDIATITTNFYIESEGYGENYYNNYLVGFSMKSSFIKSILGNSKTNVTISYKNLKLISFSLINRKNKI